MYVGIDCGASNLKIGLVTKEGKLLNFISQKSPLKEQPDQLPLIIKELVDHLLVVSSSDPEQLKAVIIGTPGPINRVQGTILASPNLGNIAPIQIVDPLVAVFNLPVYHERDTNLALLGEKWQGLAKNCRDCIMLTLGTGVGGAILIDGELYKGITGKAGEIGHIYLENRQFSVTKQLPSCGLGHAGCFEAFIQHTEPDQHPQFIGQVLASLVDIFNPEKIILGGGRATDLVASQAQIIHIMKTQALSSPAQDVEVVFSELKDQAGVLGGAYLAINTFS